MRHPIPDDVLEPALNLWRQGFAFPGWNPATCRAGHGIVALNAQGEVLAVMGLRDASGGFACAPPGWRGDVLALLYRPGPVTADLIIDGIVSNPMRIGAGRALIAEGLRQAALQGRPGLRAEVRARNRTALKFYAALGFSMVGQGRVGWVWGGRVVILRRPPRLAEDACDATQQHEGTGRSGF